MSLLTIVQKAARRCGVGRPSVAFAATDDLTGLLVDLAQESVEALGRRHGWRATRVPGQTFTTVAAALQPNVLPADYDRMAPGRTVWNLGVRRPLIGPASAEMWATLNGLAMPASIDLIYRIAGSGILLFPTPAAGITISFEYVTQNRILGADGTTLQTAFAADGDTVRFPEHLVVKDVIWRFKQEKGLDYGEDMRTFEREYELEAAADRGEGEVSTASGAFSPFGFDSLPANFWPGQIGS